MILGQDNKNKVMLSTTPVVASAGWKVIVMKHWPRILADRTARYRPILPGTSMGHIDITAGTFANPVIDQTDDQEALISNAHVQHPEPWSPYAPSRLEIIQPGSADNGTINDTVALYKRHYQVSLVGVNSDCPVARFWSGMYNVPARLLGRKTRLKATVQALSNKIDAAIAVPTVEYEKRILMDDGSLTTPSGVVGLLFAGSDADGIYIACKAQNVQDLLQVKFMYPTICPDMGANVKKAGRTTGFSEGPIEATDMSVNVWYGQGIAMFEDCIVVRAACQGGDSGSLVYV